MTALELATRALIAANNATVCAPGDPDGAVWDECTARYARKCIRRAFNATFGRAAPRYGNDAGYMARRLGLSDRIPARWYGWAL